jgi:hypothetical protein
MILSAYDRARRRGEKHSAAIAEVVLTVKAAWPEMRISETEVRRVLAEFRPKLGEVAVTVTEGIAQGPEAECWLASIKWAAENYCGKWEVPRFSHDESMPARLRTFMIEFGARPCHRRHNSRS